MEKLRFSLNVKHLRDVKNISQQGLADILGLERTSISNYERGKSVPSLELVEKISRLFNVRPSDLLYHDLKGEIDEEKLIVKDMSISYSSKNFLVPIKATAGYLDGDYIQHKEDLQEVMVPGISGEARTFEIDGDSMAPIFYPNDLAVCTRVRDYTEIKPDDIYVIVSQREGITLKRLELDMKNQNAKLISENPNHDPYSIHTDDIRELWKVRCRITTNLKLTPDQERLNNLEQQMSKVLSQLNLKP